MRRSARIGEHDAIADDLRQHTSSLLSARLDAIAGDAAAIFSHSTAEALDEAYRLGMARLLVELLAMAVGDGRLDGRRGFAAHVVTRAAERPLPPPALFAFVHLCERAALDELALDADAGVTTEAWPLVAQMVRSASFESLAAIAQAAGEAAAKGVLVDPTTALPSRAVFEMALAREAERAGRAGHALALIAFRVDGIADLDARLGRGVGEKIVERLAILVRDFFRRHDWMARTAADEISVFLSRSDAAHALDLAERVRQTVAARLASVDHRSGQPVAVTVSAAVIEVAGVADAAIDPERLLVAAEAALGRARKEGGNRVVRTDSAPISRTPPRSSPSA